MATFYDALTPRFREFIAQQKVFFVATAAENGRINLSPKGLDSIRILDDNTLLWLNLTGSGNETAAHIALKNRITLMFCAFEGKPLILRLYGTCKVYHPRDTQWTDYISLFPEREGSRQIMEVQIESVQTSCGYAVPTMEYKEDRRILDDWVDRKGRSGIETYWEEKNTESIDGFPTYILPEE